jgi:hypothetical protein
MRKVYNMHVSVNGGCPTARDAAADYLSLGLVPIPQPPRSKRPTIPGWQNLRPTTDSLDTYFPQGRELNIAILNGAPSGNIADVDLDAEEARRAAPSLLPPTGWVFGRNSARASHRIFRSDAPLETAQEAYRDVDGTMLVELRSTGSATVYPPSTHQETGERIGWEIYTHPAEVKLADLQRAVREVAAVALLARHWAAKGSRQTAFLALAGGLLREGWTFERAERFIGALALVTGDEETAKRIQTVVQTAPKVEQERHTTGWPTLEGLIGPQGQQVLRKVREWLGVARTAQWPDPVPLNEVPPVPPFPVDVLPALLQRVVREVAEALPCPEDFVAVPLLVLAATALGASRALAVKRGHIQRSILYAAVIGPPGSAKTPALDFVVEPVHDAEETIHAAWKGQMEQYAGDLDVYEAELKKWQKSRTGNRPQKPARPPLQRRTVNDATAEALVPILQENPRGVALVRDELVGWVQAMNQYRERGKGADQQFWLSAWSGSTVKVDRKKTHEQGPLRVRHPFIGVIGGLTPDKLPTLRGDRPWQRAEQDGFIDRVLLAHPRETPAAAENWREISDPTRKALSFVLERLWSLDMVPVTDPTGTVTGCRPLIVKLDAAARQEWQRFTEGHAREINSGSLPPHLVGPWAKLKGYAARLALIIHYLRWACDEAPDGDVDGESMARAARLIDYFKAHARKVYAVMDADPTTAAARRVLRWIVGQHQAHFQKRDAYQALKGTFQTIDELEPALTLLEKHGYIRPEPGQARAGPGRKPSPYYEAHPDLLRGDAHNSHNPQNQDGRPHSGDCGNCGAGVSDSNPPGDDWEEGEVP